MSRLQDKVVVITGGAGGIGRAAGALFVEEGAQVLLVDLDESALRDAVSEIGSNSISYCVADVTFCLPMPVSKGMLLQSRNTTKPASIRS
jgi:NAD(P)-dependent dehydrogenase (short-subunit alcohol dehydrogenase family)